MCKRFQNVKSTDTTNIKVLLHLAILDKAEVDGVEVTQMERLLQWLT